MVYTLGESLVDIIITGDESATLKAGGGMLNTAVSLARSGIEVSLISETGDDRIAAFINDFLKSNHVSAKYVKKYFHQSTTVAMAFLDERKKPEFTIHKSYPKNRRLIVPEHIEKEDILIFGSLYSLDPAIRVDLQPLLARARRSGALIIYDPNIRKHNLEHDGLREAFRENVAFADIIKGSDEDMINLFATKDADECLENIREINPSSIFIITRGEEGVTGFSDDRKAVLPSREVKAVSTIGAGDAFSAGLAYYLVNSKQANGWNKKTFSLEDMLNTGQSFAASVCGSLENYVSKDFNFSL